MKRKVGPVVHPNDKRVLADVVLVWRVDAAALAVERHGAVLRGDLERVGDLVAFGVRDAHVERARPVLGDTERDQSGRRRVVHREHGDADASGLGELAVGDLDPEFDLAVEVALRQELERAVLAEDDEALGGRRGVDHGEGEIVAIGIGDGELGRRPRVLVDRKVEVLHDRRPVGWLDGERDGGDVGGGAAGVGDLIGERIVAGEAGVRRVDERAVVEELQVSAGRSGDDGGREFAGSVVGVRVVGQDAIGIGRRDVDRPRRRRAVRVAERDVAALVEDGREGHDPAVHILQFGDRERGLELVVPPSVARIDEARGAGVVEWVAGRGVLASDLEWGAVAGRELEQIVGRIAGDAGRVVVDDDADRVDHAVLDSFGGECRRRGVELREEPILAAADPVAGLAVDTDREDRARRKGGVLPQRVGIVDGDRGVVHADHEDRAGPPPRERLAVEQAVSDQAGPGHVRIGLEDDRSPVLVQARVPLELGIAGRGELDRQVVAVDVGAKLAEGEDDRLILASQQGARSRDRDVVHRRDVHRDGRLVAQLAVGDGDDERVGAVEVRVALVGERPVVVDRDRAVGRAGVERERQRVALGVGRGHLAGDRGVLVAGDGERVDLRAGVRVRPERQVERWLRERGKVVEVVDLHGAGEERLVDLEVQDDVAGRRGGAAKGSCVQLDDRPERGGRRLERADENTALGIARVELPVVGLRVDLDRQPGLQIEGLALDDEIKPGLGDDIVAGDLALGREREPDDRRGLEAGAPLRPRDVTELVRRQFPRDGVVDAVVAVVAGLPQFAGDHRITEAEPIDADGVVDAEIVAVGIEPADRVRVGPLEPGIREVQQALASRPDDSGRAVRRFGRDDGRILREIRQVRIPLAILVRSHERIERPLDHRAREHHARLGGLGRRECRIGAAGPADRCGGLRPSAPAVPGPEIGPASQLAGLTPPLPAAAGVDQLAAADGRNGEVGVRGPLVLRHESLSQNARNVDGTTRER